MSVTLMTLRPLLNGQLDKIIVGLMTEEVIQTIDVMAA